MGTASDRDDDSMMSQHRSPHRKKHQCDRDGSAMCHEIQHWYLPQYQQRIQHLERFEMGWSPTL